MVNLEDLKLKLSQLYDELSSAQTELESKKAQRIHFDDQINEMKNLKYRIYCICTEINLLEKRITVYNMSPLMSDGVVDLYKKDNNPHGYYDICLTGTKTIIGEVGCNYTQNNVHYVINEDYRRLGYGFRALKLLVEYIEKCGLEDFIIIAKCDNIASIRMAEKLMEYVNCSKAEDGGFASYCFILNKEVKQDQGDFHI